MKILSDISHMPFESSHPTPYSSHSYSNQSYFLLNSLAQMPSAASHLSLLQVPIMTAPGFSDAVSWKSHEKPLGVRVHAIWNYREIIILELILDQLDIRAKDTCFPLSSPEWMVLMLISEGCSEDTIRHQSPTVRPIQGHTHVLLFSISLFNFSSSSLQHPVIGFQINFFHARPLLRLCFERNPGQSL